MSVRLTDVRCGGVGCNGVLLAKSIDARSGWVARECRKCGNVLHVGNQRRDSEPTIKLRCDGASGHRHTLAIASADWTGSAVIFCDRCKNQNTLTPAST